METGAEAGQGWHGSAPYRALLGIDQAGLAWEWLRRDPDYVACALRRPSTPLSVSEVREDPAALPWGLHFCGGPRSIRARGALVLACRAGPFGGSGAGNCRRARRPRRA